MTALEPHADWSWLPPLAGLWQGHGLIVLTPATVALLVAARAAFRLAREARRTTGGPGAPRRLSLADDRSGTTTVEFALVLPFLLPLALVLTQTTLLMADNVFVHYAAFAATRSAIVYIPANFASGLTPSGSTPEILEPPNTLVNDGASGKLAAIHQAAALALVPVSGRLSEGDVPAEAFTQGLARHYAAYGSPRPPWIDALAAGRFRYALACTRVSVLRTELDPADPEREVRFTPLEPGETAAFGPRDPITVRVLHHQNLAIPYAGWFFAQRGESDDPDDFTHPDGGRYAIVTAQYTLTNEGIAQTLPPRPNIPRMTPRPPDSTGNP